MPALTKQLLNGCIVLLAVYFVRASENEAPLNSRRIRRRRKLIKIPNHAAKEQPQVISYDKTLLENFLEENYFWNRVASSDGIRRELDMNSMSMVNVRRLTTDAIDTPTETALDVSDTERIASRAQPFLDSLLEEEQYWGHDLEMGSMSVQLMCSDTPIDLKTADIGNPTPEGKTERLSSSRFEVTGGGQPETVENVDGVLLPANDNFHFAYTKITDSFQIIARMTLSNKDTFTGRAGIMVRESFEPQALNLFAQSYAGPITFGTPFTQVALSARFQGGLFPDSGETGTAIENNDSNEDRIWFRLDRIEDKVISYYAFDTGSCTLDWIEIMYFFPPDAYMIPVDEPVLAGLAVASTKEGKVDVAVFDNVQIMSLP